MYKILCGIPAMNLPKEYLNDKHIIENYTVEDDEDIWCDFELDYYPQDNTYKFEFETMISFYGNDGCRNWIIHCLSVLTDYMIGHHYNINKELDMYSVFTEGYNVTTSFKTIEDAYAWLKIMVFGFHGCGLENH